MSNITVITPSKREALITNNGHSIHFTEMKTNGAISNSILNIGLFGFGCVGQGLYDVLNHSQGLKASIGKICVKDRNKPRPINSGYFTFDRHEVLLEDKHNLVVELTSDAEAALDIIGSSLIKGRSVVTAGKKVVAENFELLYRLQQQSGTSLLYEAACAGSIPIIRTLEEYYDNELLSSVCGILNGSSNYILSRMEFDGIAYADALRQAQSAGFAEADPTLDIDGTDAKYKLCLLAAHAFGIILKPGYIFNSGIQNVTPFDINYASQNRSRIKLVAGISKSACGAEGEGQFRAYVLPRFVSREDPLSNINNEFNGIEVEGVYSDKQFFAGKGAGSHPTGSAVLSDISAITYNYKYGYKKLKKRESHFLEEAGSNPHGKGTEYVEIDFSQDHRLLESDFDIRLYIRYNDRSELDLLDIRRVEEEHSSTINNSRYIIAQVGFSSLFNLRSAPNDLFLCEV